MRYLAPLVFIFCASPLFAQNFVKNGQFKDGINQWEVLLSDQKKPIKAHIIEHSNQYGLYGLADNYVNTSFVELDATSAIQQKLELIPTEDYTLSFAYSHRPNAGDKQLIVLVNDDVVFTHTVKNDKNTGQFHYKQLYFDAPSPTTKISFYVVSLSGAEDQGVLITDILCERTAEINIENSFLQKY